MHIIFKFIQSSSTPMERVFSELSQESSPELLGNETAKKFLQSVGITTNVEGLLKCCNGIPKLLSLCGRNDNGCMHGTSVGETHGKLESSQTV